MGGWSICPTPSGTRPSRHPRGVRAGQPGHGAGRRPRRPRTRRRGRARRAAARVLPPLFPRRCCFPSAPTVWRDAKGSTSSADRGPEQEIPWPAEAAWLDYEPKVAAVLALETQDAEADAIPERIFGYTLVSDWVAKDAPATLGSSIGVPIAIGPCA